MLQYMGSRQPPRKYTVPDVEIATTKLKHPCDICTTRVWTPELILSLSRAPIDQHSVLYTYRITSQELRKFAIEGCKFCRTLADGIHGTVFLNELYARFQRTESWPNSQDSIGSQCGDTKQIETSEEQKEQEDVAEGWNDASAFNEEEIGEDVTDGWDAWQDRDTLLEECQFTVKLAFERGEAGLFTFVNVYIEAGDGDEPVPDALEAIEREKMVELRYHINEQDSQTSSLQLFPTSTAETALGSESSMQAISAWLSVARQSNRILSHGTSHMPARLIDVHAGNSLHIVRTSTVERAQQDFCALSYVWGVNQSFVLLSSNIETFEAGFNIEELPQTIQDAVFVTRSIGLRYLWVDALCIMQDSDEDKTRELPKMRSIYRCATVTIVASVAESAMDGFLHHITESSYLIDPIVIPIPPLPTQNYGIAAILSYPAAYERWKDPINDRAWTFQEFVLSTRAIVFSYRGIEVLDRTNRPEADGMTSGRDPQLPNLPWNGRLFSLDQDPDNVRQTWLSIRGEYSRRSLTYLSDKLLAVSAVAEEIGRSYQSRYLAGLWERDLALDLQWNCLPSDNAMGERERRRLRTSEYIAPSWSWASVTASVNDFSFFPEDDPEEGGEGIKDSLGFEVISCAVELANPDFAYGAVRSGVLVVRGRLCTLSWRPHEDLSYTVGDNDGFLKTEARQVNPLYTDDTVGEATIDALDPELIDGALVVCLATRLIEHVPGRDDIEGLMLLPVSEENYRRVGFFKIYGPTELFESQPLMKVTII